MSTSHQLNEHCWNTIRVILVRPRGNQRSQIFSTAANCMSLN